MSKSIQHARGVVTPDDENDYDDSVLFQNLLKTSQTQLVMQPFKHLGIYISYSSLVLVH